MPRGTTASFTMNIRPELDRQGIAGVAKEVSAALSAGVLDKSTADRFNKNAADAGRAFRQIIVDTKAVGLREDSERFKKSMEETHNMMARAVQATAVIQAKLQKLGDAKHHEAERKILLAQQKSIADVVEAHAERQNKEIKAVGVITNRKLKAEEDVAKIKEQWAEDGALKSKAAMLEGFGGGMEDAISGAFSNIKQGDMGGFIKTLGGAFGKAGEGMKTAGAVGMGGQAASGAMTSMAGMAATAAAAAAAIAAVVAAIAAVVAIMMEATAQAKEWNAVILQGASAADFGFSEATAGAGQLADRLDEVRESAWGLAYQFRMTPKEIIGITSAFNEAGLTFKEMSGITKNNTTAMQAYADVTKTAIVFSKTLGKSTQEIAEQSAKWAEGLNMGLIEIQSGFSSIFAAAMQSGISVKRFYTMVTAATSNMSLYNLRIEEASALIAELSESLGEDAAGTLVSSLADGFASEGYQDRIKRILTTSSKVTATVFEENAKTLGKNFKDRVESLSGKIEVPVVGKDGKETGETEKVDTAEFVNRTLQKVKINLANLGAGGETGKAEIAKLNKLENKDRRELITAVRAVSPGIAGQLDTLVDAAGGMTKDIGKQAKALETLGPGGTLAMQLSSASSIVGANLSDMTATQLMAFEQISGYSGKQTMELRKIDRQLRGNFEAGQAALEAQRNSDVELTQDQKTAMAREIGMVVEGTRETARLVAAAVNENGNYVAGEVVSSVTGYISTQGSVLKKAVSGGMDTMTAMATETAMNTNSILTQLETGVSFLLEKIYDAMTSIWELLAGSKWFGGTAIEAKAKKEAIQASESQEEKLLGIQGTIKTQMSQTRIAANEAQGEEQDALLAELKRLEERGKDVEDAIEREKKVRQTARGVTGETTVEGVRAAAEKTEEEKRKQQKGEKYLAALEARGRGEAVEGVDSAELDQFQTALKDAVIEGMGSRDVSVTATRMRKKGLLRAKTEEEAKAERGIFAANQQKTPEEKAADNKKLYDMLATRITDSLAAASTEEERAELRKAMAQFGEFKGDLFIPKGRVKVADLAGGVAEVVTGPEEILSPEALENGMKTVAEQEAAAAEKTDVKIAADQTDELNKAQKEEFDRLLKEYPDMTEEGFLEALKKKEMEDVAKAATAPGGNWQETLARMQQNKGIGEQGIARLKELGMEREIAQHGYSVMGPESQDFLYRGGVMGGTITPINKADEFLGAKPGGPVAGMLAGAGGNITTININGGDTAKIYEVVKRAVNASSKPGPGA